MPQFRVTQKYAKDCRISTLVEPRSVAHLLDDWFIDVMRVGRKKIAVATHGRSRFTFFIPYAEVGGAAGVPGNISILLKQFLLKHHFSEYVEQVEMLFKEPTTFCKTVNKKILGHMNDFKRCTDVSIHYLQAHSHPINWVEMADEINHMPVNLAPVGYIFPHQMLLELLKQRD